MATVGFHGIDWSFRTGISQMFVVWAGSPVASAAFGAMIFLLVKNGVMEKAKPVRWALAFLPFFYALTGAMLSSKTLFQEELILIDLLGTNFGSAHRLERSRSSHNSPQPLACGPGYSSRSWRCNWLRSPIFPLHPTVPLPTSYPGRLAAKMASLLPRPLFATKKSISA